MLSFWAGGISSFPPCARKYRLLRRLPLQRSVYLITCSQWDASIRLTKGDVAKVILDSWKACYRCRVVQWVASKELHQNGGRPFHMAIKLSTKSRWLRARNYIDKEDGIKVNFSGRHDNYYGAYRYVTKEDCEFIVSPNLPPKTSNATKKRKSLRKSKL